MRRHSRNCRPIRPHHFATLILPYLPARSILLIWHLKITGAARIGGGSVITCGIFADARRPPTRARPPAACCGMLGYHPIPANFIAMSLWAAAASGPTYATMRHFAASLLSAPPLPIRDYPLHSIAGFAPTRPLPHAAVRCRILRHGCYSPFGSVRTSAASCGMLDYALHLRCHCFPVAGVAGE